MPIIGSLGSGSAGGFGQRAAAGIVLVTGSSSFTSGANATFNTQAGKFYNYLNIYMWAGGGGGLGGGSFDIKTGHTPGNEGTDGGGTSCTVTGSTDGTGVTINLSLGGGYGRKAVRSGVLGGDGGSTGTGNNQVYNVAGNDGTDGDTDSAGEAGGVCVKNTESVYQAGVGNGGAGGAGAGSGRGGAGGGGSAAIKFSFTNFTAEGANYVYTVGAGGSGGSGSGGASAGSAGGSGLIVFEWEYID